MQTIRTVNELITSAFYIIGEFSEEEPIMGVDFQRGFDIMNGILNEFSTVQLYIPFNTVIEFDLVAGQQDYVISNYPGVVANVTANRIVGIEYGNLSIDGIIFPLKVAKDSQIYPKLRVEDIFNVPSLVLLTPYPTYSLVSFYNAPDRIYHVTLRVKSYLDKFEKNTPIVNIPLGAQEYLTYLLAKKLIAYYPSGNWAPSTEEIYQQTRRDFLLCNSMDLTIQNSALMMRKGLYPTGRFLFGGGP